MQITDFIVFGIEQVIEQDQADDNGHLKQNETNQLINVFFCPDNKNCWLGLIWIDSKMVTSK